MRGPFSQPRPRRNDQPTDALFLETPAQCGVDRIRDSAHDGESLERQAGTLAQLANATGGRDRLVRTHELPVQPAVATTRGPAQSLLRVPAAPNPYVTDRSRIQLQRLEVEVVAVMLDPTAPYMSTPRRS